MFRSMCFIVGCMVSGSAWAVDTVALDQRVQSLMKTADAPGLGVAVIEDGKVTFLKAYGFRDLDQRAPLTPDTTLYAASLTKAAFAYAVMGLVQDGRLALDRSIAKDLPKPLPDYPKYADLAGDARWKRLTPALLLRHQSGFPNFRFWPPGKAYDPNAKLAFYQEPGTRYGYSGEGINLLQFVLEEGMGIDVATLMSQRLFEPLAMTRTSMTWRPDFAANLAIGYDEDGKALGHTQRQSVRAAGSMDTTLADFSKLVAAMARGDGLRPGTYDTWLRPAVRIRSTQQFPTIGSPDTDRYDGIRLSAALGVVVFDSPQGPAFFKTGHDDGTNNVFVCLRWSRRCVLLMSNSSRGVHFCPADRRGAGPHLLPVGVERLRPGRRRAAAPVRCSAHAAFAVPDLTTPGISRRHRRRHGCHPW